jgi:hypothetical protein
MKKDSKLLWVAALVMLSMGLVGCTSMIGFKDGDRPSGQAEELKLTPGYYTVWTEIPKGDGNVIFWFGKTNPKGGYITINKIFANTQPSEDGAVTIVDYTANPFETPESVYWWANFEKNITGGKYSCGTSSGEKWGGGFNHRNFRNYTYIGFSILLDKTTFARLGDALVEIDGTYIKFADMVKPLLQE